jgi:hypothetical protein
MVGHHHKFIQFNIRIFLWYLIPPFMNHLTEFVQLYSTIFYFLKKAFPIPGADCDEIGTCLGLIITSQSNRLTVRQPDGSMVFIRIANHSSSVIFICSRALSTNSFTRSILCSKRLSCLRFSNSGSIFPIR